MDLKEAIDKYFGPIPKKEDSETTCHYLLPHDDLTQALEKDDLVAISKILERDKDNVYVGYSSHWQHPEDLDRHSSHKYYVDVLNLILDAKQEKMVTAFLEKSYNPCYKKDSTSHSGWNTSSGTEYYETHNGAGMRTRTNLGGSAFP